MSLRALLRYNIAHRRNNTFVYILSIDKEETGSYNMIAKIFTEVKL